MGDWINLVRVDLDMEFFFFFPKSAFGIPLTSNCHNITLSLGPGSFSGDLYLNVPLQPQL